MQPFMPCADGAGNLVERVNGFLFLYPRKRVRVRGQKLSEVRRSFRENPPALARRLPCKGDKKPDCFVVSLLAMTN